jgi:hypothetical protein
MTPSDLYPEHEKLAKISDQSQICGEFIEWLEQHHIHLCEPDRDNFRDRYWPTHKSIQVLLAAFFDIDLKRIDAEKEAMLDAMRAVNP